MDSINDSIVVGKNNKDDEEIVLFVKLPKSKILTSELKRNIIFRLKEECSPRHVPTYILQIDDIPYTINGKKVEIAIKDIINGSTPRNVSSIANPNSLDLYKNFKELI